VQCAGWPAARSRPARFPKALALSASPGQVEDHRVDHHGTLGRVDLRARQRGAHAIHVVDDDADADPAASVSGHVVDHVRTPGLEGFHSLTSCFRTTARMLREPAVEGEPRPVRR
jgi:hypothetical protein